MVRVRALAVGVTILVASSAASPAFSASCMDLWTERNRIFAEAGYCFTTSLGQRVFANYDCWTSNPDLTPQEQRRVTRIKAEEARRGCKVN